MVQTLSHLILSIQSYFVFHFFYSCGYWKANIIIIIIIIIIIMSVRLQTQLVYSLNCLFNINLLHLYISLTVVSLFCITHSRQYVLYHSLSSVCSVSLTVVSITHSHPIHSQSSQSLTVLFFVQLIH